MACVLTSISVQTETPELPGQGDRTRGTIGTRVGLAVIKKVAPWTVIPGRTDAAILGPRNVPAGGAIVTEGVTRHLAWVDVLAIRAIVPLQAVAVIIGTGSVATLAIV